MGGVGQEEGRRGATRQSGMAQTKGYIKLIQSQSGSAGFKSSSISSKTYRRNMIVCWWLLVGVLNEFKPNIKFKTVVK